MIPIETISGMGTREIKENGGVVAFNMINLIYCKNFCKWHNVPQPSTTIKKKPYY
jgi:hypothetical protein